MNTEQKQRVAIVTGASRGIGAAIAKNLGKDNIAVVVNYISDARKAEEVVTEIKASGGHAFSIKADVSKSAEVATMFDRALSHFGGVDILINNAGIMHENIPLKEMDDGLFNRVMAVNIKGPFNTMRLAEKKLREGGRVINLSTSVTKLRMPNYSLYAASKSAVETMTAIFAKEMGKRQITVNAVAPGPTTTELFLDGKSDEKIQEMANMNPLGRLGEPEDIAKVVSFLVSSEADWVNGQTLFVNGGII